MPIHRLILAVALVLTSLPEPGNSAEPLGGSFRRPQTERLRAQALAEPLFSAWNAGAPRVRVMALLGPRLPILFGLHPGQENNLFSKFGLFFMGICADHYEGKNDLFQALVQLENHPSVSRMKSVHPRGWSYTEWKMATVQKKVDGLQEVYRFLHGVKGNRRTSTRNQGGRANFLSWGVTGLFAALVVYAYPTIGLTVLSASLFLAVQNGPSDPSKTKARQWFDQIIGEKYDTIIPILRRILYSRGVDENYLNELIQETLVKAIQNVDQLRKHEFNVLISWLTSIALNIFRTNLRKTSRLDPISEAVEAADDFQNLMNEEIDRRRINEIIEGIIAESCHSTTLEKIVTLRLDGFRYTQIANKLGMPTAAATRVRYFRLMKKLREIFKPKSPSSKKTKGRRLKKAA